MRLVYNEIFLSMLLQSLRIEAMIHAIDHAIPSLLTLSDASSSGERSLDEDSRKCISLWLRIVAKTCCVQRSWFSLLSLTEMTCLKETGFIFGDAAIADGSEEPYGCNAMFKILKKERRIFEVYRREWGISFISLWAPVIGIYIYIL